MGGRWKYSISARQTRRSNDVRDKNAGFFDGDFMNGFVLSCHTTKSAQMGLFHANYKLNPASDVPAMIINGHK